MYFDKNWFLTPENKNAFKVYKKVLQIEPDNRQAREKLRNMMGNYRDWGDNNYTQGNFNKAKMYYQRYLTIADYMVYTLKDFSIIEEFQEIEALLKTLDATPTPSPTLTPQPPVPSQTPMPSPTLPPTPTPSPLPTLTPLPPLAPSPTVSPILTTSPAPPPLPPPPQKPFPRTKKADLYAVIIGIGEYQDERLNLKFTVNDARGFYNILTDPRYRGVPKENIQLLLNQDATDRNIKRQIGRWLQRQAGKEDTVIIYYAGHGAVDEEGDAYWVTYNADIHDLYSTALRDSVIIDMLKRISSERVITFLDACHGAATVIEQDMGTRALSQGIPWEKFSGKGRVIISASNTEQKSLELEEYQHGVFTYYLLKGLQGDADSWAGEEADGIVEVDEIWNYVRKQVIEAIQHQGGPLQEPVRSGTVTAGIPLTFNRPSLEKKHIGDLYRAGDISSEQFRKAVDMIESGEKDQMLEDFLSGDLPLEYFKEYF